jgi:hypothetical protein
MQAGHFEVEKHEVRLMSSGQGQGGLAFRGEGHPVAGVGQKVFESCAHSGMIVDDEDVRHGLVLGTTSEDRNGVECQSRMNV